MSDGYPLDVYPFGIPIIWNWRTLFIAFVREKVTGMPNTKTGLSFLDLQMG